MSTSGGSSHHSSAGGSNAGGTKITPELEAKWKDIPDKYLMIIAHFLSGTINDTDAYDKYNGPVMKSSIKSVYWIFLIQYAVLSILGVLMNVAIIAYIMYHKLYKDVTHAFIINLALCHFVQCAVVLPITLMVMMIQNWIFGQFLCFFLPMLQDIPLHVAMISHILIAWDRMRWLGDPMRGRLPAFVCCCATWLTGMVIALPYPIYTMYVEIGDYVPRLSGIGLCVVNLMDDMHEYMRGLFVIMYCGPTILLAYLYIRTSQELRPPDGPLAVMMFEHRADIRNRQRNSSTTSVERIPGRGLSSEHTTTTTTKKSYDLYNAEMDICREKRKQRNLGSMAAAQVVCLCPLMILRLARMVMVETYENTKHFDFTYLMFVWIAFLPTVIFPCIYASQILPRTEKERLRGYFRISTKRLKKSRQDSQEESIEKDDNTTTTQTTTIIHNGGCTMNGGGGSDKKLKQHHRAPASSIISKDGTTNSQASIKINVIGDGIRKTSSSSVSSRNNGYAAPSIHTKTTAISAPNHKVTNGLRPAAGGRKGKNSIDSINNSCSNITASTYCNNSSINDAGSGYDGETSSIVSGMTGTTDKEAYFEKKWESVNGAPHLLRHKDASFSDCGSFSRMDSSSTLERDLEIIDFLERERSMDIQDMMEREKRSETIRLVSGSGSERRRLPDLEKICKSPKPKIDPYSYETVTPTVTPKPTAPPHPMKDDVIANQNTVDGDCDDVGTGDFFNDDYQPPPPSAPASTTSSYYHHHSRRLSRKSSHHSNHSNRSKRDSFNSLNSDLMAGAFGELDPTQPLNKMSVIESRMRRSSGRTPSISSSGRSSLKSRDYQQQHSHPELDFRENIFAEL